jgi:hypothetical protein
LPLAIHCCGYLAAPDKQIIAISSGNLQPLIKVQSLHYHADVSSLTKMAQSQSQNPAAQ